MTSAGPTWLRTELPQPIARAWHLAITHRPRDGNVDAQVVELALRLVTGLQLASLAFEGRLGSTLDDPNLKRPLTLGTLAHLVVIYRDKAREPFVAALARWPQQSVERALRALTEVRNRLSHAGNAQRPREIRERDEREASAHAIEVLTSLEWLRACELVVVDDMVPATLPRMRGHLRIYRGEQPHPIPQDATWEGEPALDHLYLMAPRERPGHLLDVAPFVHLTSPSGGETPITIWDSIGKRGDVSFRSPDDKRGFLRLAAQPIVSFARLGEGAPSEAPTRYERPALEPPTASARPAAKASQGERRDETPQPARARRRWPWVVGLALVALVAILVVVLTTQRADDPGAAARAAAARDCPAADLGTAWLFDTEVLSSHAEARFGLGVRGHYEVTFASPTGCALPAMLTKRGWTQAGKRVEYLQEGRPTFIISPSGHSAAASAELRASPGAEPAGISMRVTRHGDALLGLWRHEGKDWARSGYSGALVGRPAGAPDPAREPGCFYKCLRACHAGGDPLDDAAETCLLGCTNDYGHCTR